MIIKVNHVMFVAVGMRVINNSDPTRGKAKLSI
jgi:hypothetical protein